MILEAYNGFRHRKGWHSTLEKNLDTSSIGFQFYQQMTTWLEALLVNWSKLALLFYGNSKLQTSESKI